MYLEIKCRLIFVSCYTYQIPESNRSNSFDKWMVGSKLSVLEIKLAITFFYLTKMTNWPTTNLFIGNTVYFNLPQPSMHMFHHIMNCKRLMHQVQLVHVHLLPWPGRLASGSPERHQLNLEILRTWKVCKQTTEFQILWIRHKYQVSSLNIKH